MAKEIKHKIKEAIQQFNNGNLSENALNLFQTLGYNTERQQPFEKKTYACFRDLYLDNDNRFNAEKALASQWNYIDLLFQLSKTEISRQHELFDTRQVDRTIIETYLFFAIELREKSYSRTALSQITREMNKVFSMPVMILFKHGNSLTLSVINRRLHKRDEQKDVLEKVTLIKDIRISPAGGGVRRTGVEVPLKKGGEEIVSENSAATHRAHIEILFDLSFDELKDKHRFTNFVELHNAWQKTLDTSELNKRFFRELANWYFWAMDNVEFPDDAEQKKDVRNATNLIRLITRLVFTWFIKEKDLLPGSLFSKNHLSAILKGFNEGNTSNVYYHAILQNLFFGTLNQKMGERGFAKEGSFPENKNEYGVKTLFRYADKFSIKEKEIIALFKDIPFLNGGLFDCLDKEEVVTGASLLLKEKTKSKIIYVDGFSRNPKKQAKVPDFLFFSDETEVDLNEIFGTRNKKYKVKGLINLLDSYKFTVAENTPVEEEIALDPELLGKVFENLLASYNPETQTTARKQTGSFYTPREIVNYMVDESLIAYLSTASIPAGGNNYPFFNPNDEIKIHQGNLPHWQQEDVFYFVTFRLADSIPKEKVEQLRQERETWLKNHPKNKEGKYSTEELKEYYRLFSKRVEEWLDKGAGGCILREEKYAQIIADALLCFNNQRYILDKWVVMPNHVHVLVKPLKNYNLTDILHSWKSYTANEINKYTGGKGQLWMHESYDHIVRNREAFEAICNYIRQNPAKAGITLPDCAKSWTESTASIPAGGEARLRKLLSYSDEPHDFTEGETKLIISAIDNCKILDPACGSGAFPMGMLHKLVHVLQKLDPENRHWHELQYQKALRESEEVFKQSSASIPAGEHGSKDAPATLNKKQREERLKEINEAFDEGINYPDYGRKLYLIENCIYGVDIQPIAVQIAKLRFFISLIIDEKKQPGRENLGIRSLPNLETKFVAANTLIGLDRPAQLTFRNPEIEKKEQELKQIRHKYFNANTRKEKLDCQKKDKKLREKLSNEIKRILIKTNDDDIKKLEHDLKQAKQELDNIINQPEEIKIIEDTNLFGKKEEIKIDKKLKRIKNQKKAINHIEKLLNQKKNPPESTIDKVAEKIANFDLYDQNASADWFDPEWMFGVASNSPLTKGVTGGCGGFDIVIGNPPYMIIQTLTESCHKLIRYYKDNYKSATGKFDIYCLFTEKGLSLINPAGILNFIMPSKWIISGFGSGLRTVISQNQSLYKFISFNSFQVFNASTYTSLLWLTRIKNRFAITVKLNKDIIDSCDLYDWLQNHTYVNSVVVDNYELTNGPWSFSNKKTTTVLKKIMTYKEISRYLEGVFQGIVTGDNDIFWLNNSLIQGGLITGFSKALNQKVTIESSITFPFLNGRTIGRYKCKFNNTYIIYPYKLVESKTEIIDETQLLRLFPLTHAYFLKLKDRLINRGSETMKYPLWYSLWNQRTFERLQKKGKILTPDVSYKGSMWKDSEGRYFYADTSYAIIVKKNFLQYSDVIYSILNSSMLWFYLQNTGAVQRGGFFRFKTNYLKPFPVPEIDFYYTVFFSKIVPFVSFLSEHNNDNREKIHFFEALLDAMVYELYLPEEIKAADCEVLKHIAKLPEVKDDWSDEKKLAVIEKIYKELSDSKHPVSMAMFKMDTIEEIRIIEGKQ